MIIMDLLEFSKTFDDSQPLNINNKAQILIKYLFCEVIVLKWSLNKISGNSRESDQHIKLDCTLLITKALHV